MLDPFQMVLVGVATLLAMVLQGTVGFGAGMLAIPLFLWAGLRLPESIAIMLAMVLFQTGYSAWRYRRDVPWAAVGWMALWRAMGLPIGIGLLAALVGLGQDRVKQVVGAALLLAVLVQWLGKVQPRNRLAAGWLPTAGLSSGILAGTVGMGGPPLVLWAVAHRWPSRRTRSFLWASFLLATPLHLGLLVWKFGWSIVAAGAVGVLFVPLALAGVHLGHALGNRLAPARLRVAAFVVLLVLAAASIVGPWI